MHVNTSAFFYKKNQTNQLTISDWICSIFTVKKNPYSIIGVLLFYNDPPAFQATKPLKNCLTMDFVLIPHLSNAVHLKIMLLVFYPYGFAVNL